MENKTFNAGVTPALQYEAPQLTVVEFKAERGFAGSGEERAFSLFGLSKDGYNNNGQENWDDNDNSLFGSW
ncbi:MAG: hypothetical protein IJ634_04580 [Bacteroidales bacterium]|nr:hypothetical protein [Bacteroidales bacterium]